MTTPRFYTDGDATKRLFEHITSGSCDKKVILELLDNGADICINDNYMHGNTLLIWQIANALIEHVDDLLNIVAEYHFKVIPEIFGAFINKKDNEGKTALHLASLKGWHHKSDTNINGPEMHVAIKSLIMHGADINLSDKRGNTPLHIAVLRRDIDAVKYFLSHGAYLSKKNSLGLKPIQMLQYDYNQAFEQVCSYTPALALTMQSEESFHKGREEIEGLFHAFESQNTKNIFDLPGDEDNVKAEPDIDSFIDSMHGLFINNKYSTTNVSDVLKLMRQNNIVLPQHQLAPLNNLITVVNKENATAKIFGYSNTYWDCFCQFVKGLFGKDRESMIKKKCDKFKNTICEKNNFIPSYSSLKNTPAFGNLNSEPANTNIVHPKCDVRLL